MQSEPAWTVSPRRAAGDEGMALVTVIMVMMLVSALMVGFVAAVVADNRASGLDRDQTQAYAAAHAGLEKLTSDLSNLFLTDFSPSPAQIGGLLADSPVVPGFQYVEPDGSSGYKVTWDFSDASGNPAPDPTSEGTITHGPYQGFKGLITPYNITVTARSTGGAEVRMRRTLQTIAVPVFQFGMFSENDLSFHAGADFNFGGRVHTNAHLYIAEGNGATLTLADRVTAVGEVIRTNLSNGWDTNTNYTGTVNVPTTIMANPVNNINRALKRTEGSLVGTVGSAANVGPPSWTTLSVGTYHSNIRNGLTGAKRLDLPLVSQGAVPVDLIRRPLQNSNESVTAPLIYQQRYFSQASLRILLSDTAADITNLPTVTATPPVPLDGTATAAQYNVGAAIPGGGTVPPMAASPGPASTNSSGITNQAATVTINTTTTTLPFDPVLTIGATSFTCTGKTANTFSGCVGTPAAAAGSVVSSEGASTTLAAATAAGSMNIAVASTVTFVPRPFWWGNNIITCTGYTNTQFTTCTGLSAATGNMPSNSGLTTAALSTAGQPTLNGFIKIEKKDDDGNWTDVTTEILNLGIAAPNQSGTICADPNPNAVIRIQRLRDNGGICNYAGSSKSTDYWSNALYDVREGRQRDDNATTSAAIALGGVMHYVALDVNNLRRWYAGTIGTTGTVAKNDNGYIVYFSDRRNNRNPTAGQCGALAVPCESGRVRVRRRHQPRHRGRSAEWRPRHRRGQWRPGCRRQADGRRKRGARDLRPDPPEPPGGKYGAAEQRRAPLVDTLVGGAGHGQPSDPVPPGTEADQRRARQPSRPASPSLPRIRCTCMGTTTRRPTSFRRKTTCRPRSSRTRSRCSPRCGRT